MKIHRMTESEKTIDELEKEIERLKEIREQYEDIIGSEWGDDSYLIKKD